MMQSQSNNTCHKDKTEFVQVSKWQVSCSRYHWIRLYCSFALCPLLFQGMVFLLPYSTRINLQPKLHQSTLFQASEISTEVWTQPWLNTTTKASNFMAPSCNATAKQSVQFLPSKKITRWWSYALSSQYQVIALVCVVVLCCQLVQHCVALVGHCNNTIIISK